MAAILREKASRNILQLLSQRGESRRFPLSKGGSAAHDGGIIRDVVRLENGIGSVFLHLTFGC